MMHPFFCYLGVALSFTVSLTLFASGRLDVQRYFYAPLVLLIGFYTAHGIITDRERYLPRSLRQVLPKAIGKTLMWGLILWAIVKFYGAHPLYRDFTPETRQFLEHFLRLFWIGGPLYFFLAEKFRYSRDNCMGDLYLRVLSLLRALARREFGRIGRRLSKRPYRRFYLMGLIRIHYVPIMVQQVHYHVTALTHFFQGEETQWSLTASLWMVTTLAWLIDSNNGAMGYFWESWFTKTRFRDIDPHPMHWLVVLMCYVPFIDLSSLFAPFPALPDHSVLLISHAGLNMAVEVVLVTALVLYMLSGCALGFSTSNLCYKKIQTRGPYAIVRHPATACKLAFFFLAFFRYREAFTLAGLLCYGAWFTVYVCRALVEERFLCRYEDYRTYMKKTRYRFVPGVC